MPESLPKLLQILAGLPRPRELNFQVNDICNARCVMCNIWKNRRGTELDPTQLKELLQHPFFADVRHVGITGGEPTLRADLGDFFSVLPQALPELKSASFITNGFLTERAVAIFAQVNRLYTSAKLGFSGMVSIDGIGDVHDGVRGRPGSFSKATATLFGLRNAGIPVHACCTVVRKNVWGLHELLDWGLNHQVYVRFRVGEFINRLYNNGNTEEIRAFAAEENRHLVSFFHKLVLEYEPEERVRRTYLSILSILSGGERLTGCPYQFGHAINVDSAARFAICAPKGTPASLGANPASAAAGHRWERLRILQRHCKSCIHDYHSEWSQRELADREGRRLTKLHFAAALKLREFPPALTHPIRHLLVAGWYGTETAGDIAILAGLVQHHQRQGVIRFTVLSLYPFYSRVTLEPIARELGAKLDVLPYDSPLLARGLNSFDAVAMGGGPLLDIEPVETIRLLFRRAREAGLPCLIDGCGIGPLNVPRYQEIVTEILELATAIRLRDAESLALAQRLVPGIRATVVEDPSVGWIEKTGIHWVPTAHRIIRVFARELTHEYPQSTPPKEANERIVSLIRSLLGWYPHSKIELCAMHWFPVGWDDREFASWVARHVTDPRVVVDWVPRTPRELLERIAAAELNVCLRFHSIVFAHSIGAPYVPIDYTAGGKILSFLRRHGAADKALGYSELSDLDEIRFRASIVRGQSAIP